MTHGTAALFHNESYSDDHLTAGKKPNKVLKVPADTIRKLLPSLGKGKALPRT